MKKTLVILLAILFTNQSYFLLSTQKDEKTESEFKDEYEIKEKAINISALKFYLKASKKDRDLFYDVCERCGCDDDCDCDSKGLKNWKAISEAGKKLLKELGLFGDDNHRFEDVEYVWVDSQVSRIYRMLYRLH